MGVTLKSDHTGRMMAMLSKRGQWKYIPGVAGEAGADKGIEGRDGDIISVQDAVHPAIRHDVGPIGKGTAYGDRAY